MKADDGSVPLRDRKDKWNKDDPPGYVYIYSVAEELQTGGVFLKGFQSDLTTHDRNTLRGLPRDAQFIWAVFRAATTLTTKASLHDPQRSPRWKESVLPYIESLFLCLEPTRVHYWDGRAGRELTQRRDATQIIEEWRRTGYGKVI